MGKVQEGGAGSGEVKGELEAAKREVDRQTREVGDRDRVIGNMYDRLRERVE